MKEYAVYITVADDPNANTQDVYTEREIREGFPKFADFILTDGFSEIEYVFDLTHVKIQYLNY